MEGEKKIMHYRKAILLLMFGIFSSFVLFGSLPDSPSGVSLFDLKFENPQVAVSWNTSDYILFVGPSIEIVVSMYYKIFIDDTDPSYNWSVTAANNSWLTGSGTFLDPYVIEGLYIDAGGLGGMISIWNSDKFFIIRNNWFNYSGPYGHDNGVLLQFAKNGVIENNIFTYTHIGVLAELLCDNTIISDNIMISDHTTAGFGKGIDVQWSDNVTVINNKIRNHYSAVKVLDSSNVTVDSNYLENNIFDIYDAPPLELERSNDSSMIRNKLAGAYADAAFRISEVDSSGNTIINNTAITGEPLSFGPETAGVTLNSPKLQATPADTILIDQSHNNLIAHNRLLRSGSGVGSIQGFDIFVLMGMFGLISVLIVAIRRKKQ